MILRSRLSYLMLVLIMMLYSTFHLALYKALHHSSLCGFVVLSAELLEEQNSVRAVPFSGVWHVFLLVALAGR